MWIYDLRVSILTNSEIQIFDKCIVREKEGEHAW